MDFMDFVGFPGVIAQVLMEVVEPDQFFGAFIFV